ncbi:MAG: hypothetical protein H0T20_02055 [Actinobacteria bacterium]|nr:hypothetical protein [Actinomycetota bacterium]
MVGTLRWAERTQGRLRARDRLALQAQIARLLLERVPRALRRRLSTEKLQTDLERIRPPETATAHAAADLCVEASSEAIANHAFRTYLWARLLALRDGVGYDDELLYVASVLHDLGLTERFWGRDGSACFSVDGGEAAREFAAAQGWPRGRTDALAEALVLHLNVQVRDRQGVEARLMQSGTTLDVTGARLGGLARDTADAVVARHPRLGLKSEFADWFRREIERRPDARLAFLDDKVGLGRRMLAAPFES